ncbi:uncharacterized protein HKW66_Vig0081570 [Vigna angularis]|uniref:Uncharacterized protein n=1 Tax=Phaseolus angularis TaxID=3914 RepID=A0A8T0KIP1_PHAAN|nr:uncharacterized protein HKW66_Vig0081570 [Vigna angularis]
MEELGEQSKRPQMRKKLVFRHFCKTKFIGALNEQLTSEHKGYIEKIVFCWLLCLPDCIKIGLPVVGEVIDLNKVWHRSVCRDYFPNGKVDVNMKEELFYGMVEDVVQKYGVPYNKKIKGDKEKLICVVEEQTRVIADMQSSIDDIRKLVEAKNQDKGEDFVEQPFWGSEDRCQSTPVQHQHQPWCLKVVLK